VHRALTHLPDRCPLQAVSSADSLGSVCARRRPGQRDGAAEAEAEAAGGRVDGVNE